MIKRILSLFDENEKNKILNYCFEHEISKERFITEFMNNYCLSDVIEHPEIIRRNLMSIVA